MTKTIKAVGLLSGGLDSTIAAAMLMRQGIEVQGLTFYTGFCVVEHNRRSKTRKRAKPIRNDALQAGAKLNLPVEMIDIFRSSEAAKEIVIEALKLKSYLGLKLIWMQLGIKNEYAANLAKKNGIEVVMDRCPKIEYGRLFGELGWMGINTGIITSKRSKVS